MVAGQRNQRGAQTLGQGLHVRAYAGCRFAARRIKAVVLANVQNDAVERKDAVDQPGQVADQPVGILKEHHFLAEGVQPPHIRLPLHGLRGLFPRPLGQPAHHDASQCERDHRHPGLRAHQSKCVEWRQKIIVEGDCAQSCHVQRKDDSRLARRPHHQHQKDHSRGGGISAQPGQQKGGEHGCGGGQEPAKNMPGIGADAHRLPHRNHNRLSRFVKWRAAMM